MVSRRCSCVGIGVFMGTLLTGSAAPAQTPTPSPAQIPAPIIRTQDPDARIDLTQPDFRLVNLPTTLLMPVRRFNFEMTHRFNGNFLNGSFTEQLENLFGLDQGASIGLGLRYGLVRHVHVTVFRTNIERTIQFSGRWDWWQQSADRFVSLSVVSSVEGTDNFRDEYQPSIGVVVSRKFGDRLAVYASPMFVDNTSGGVSAENNTTFVGLGARVRFGQRAYLVGEVAPRLDGYTPGDPSYGFAIEKRVGGHVFQLTFTNSPATTIGQIARGGFPETLSLGFNLSRKFF